MLVELSRNEKLLSIYERAPLPLQPPPFIEPEAFRKLAKQTITEHRDLQQLIRNRRVTEAIELLERHLHTSLQLTPVY